MKATATTDASCADVQSEIVARLSGTGNWVDPHNGGIYTLLSSENGVIASQRTTNPETSVGGQVYTDKQTFVLSTRDEGGCKIEGCSEAQGPSGADFSTNYCNLRNLYCGSADGCSPVSKDFTSTEVSHKGSLLAGHDFGVCIVAPTLAAQSYQCPGSGAAFHASMKVTATAQASCATVQKEIEARAGGGSWVDPHNGGIYSVLSSENGVVQTQRTTNPATSVGGQVYTDKQTFALSDSDGQCKIEGCSESQGASGADFSTNYCNLRNLYCGSADGCTAVTDDFASTEVSHKGSLLAGHDFSACIVKAAINV